MKKIAYIFGLITVMVGMALPLYKSVAADTFTSNNVIDDWVFDNAYSLNAGQINNFLNSLPNSCISPNSGFSARLPIGYSPSGGFNYGGFVSAGDVIANAAVTYGINPQVLISTLQKEQSLVAGGAGYCNNGDEHKYSAAMGYGCPDGGTRYSYSGVSLYMRNGVEHTNSGTTCVNSAAKTGFSQQVIRSAWLLKFGEQRSKGNTGWAVIKDGWNNSDDPAACYGGPMTQGTLSRGCGQAATYFDGYTTIDGVSTHVDNGATAALYWYTPHFSGNRSFFNIFNGWFGSVKSSPFFSYNGTVYIAGANNTYYGINSQAVLDAYGLGTRFPNIINYVSPSYTSGMTYRGILPSVARFENNAIYAVDKNGLHHFSDETIYTDFGYSFGDEAVLPQYLFSYYSINTPMQHVILQSDRPEIYFAESGKKRHISSWDAYITQGNPIYNTQAAVKLSSEYVGSLPEGAPVLTPGEVVKTSDTQATFIWSAGNLQPVSSSTTATWGLKTDYSRPSSILGLLPSGGSMVTQFAADAGGTKYLLDGGKKYSLSSDQVGQLKNEPSFAVAGNDILNRFSVTSMSDLIRQSQSSAVYLLKNSKLYHVASETDLAGLGYTFNDVRVLSAQPETLFTDSNGGIFTYGRLVRVANTAPVYVVDGLFSMRHVPSEQMMMDYGFSFSNVAVVSASDITTYNTSNTLGQLVNDGTSNLVVDSGCKLKVVGFLLTTYNYSSDQFVPTVSDIIGSRMRNCPDLTNLVRAQNRPEVYKIDNGTKRWVTTEAAFNRNGFSWNNVRVMGPAFVNSFTSGPNID